ncbi:C40 family peptidase [Nocardia sp. NPDC049149]|uniref:C40 family peptidase n=1 Tax=Nocardia sp. NPDC049149 TaxID=3364315 RepID=UPI00371E30E3
MMSTTVGRYCQYLRHGYVLPAVAGAVCASAIAAAVLPSAQAPDDPPVGLTTGVSEASGAEPDPAGAPENLDRPPDNAPPPMWSPFPGLQFPTIPGIDLPKIELPKLDIPGIAPPPATLPPPEAAAPPPEAPDASPPDTLSPPPAPPTPPPPLFDVPSAPLLPPPLPPLPAPDTLAPIKTVGELAVDAARSKLGAAYSYAAAGPDSFDCSGLVQWAYKQAGVDLPRTSYQQLAAGTPISVHELQVGDLVTFYRGSHSALYLGDGTVIHAGTYSTGVTISPISSMPFAEARRFHADGLEPAPPPTSSPKPWSATQVVAVSRPRK